MFSRGKIVSAELERAILFNDEFYTSVRIEIDHINFGLNQETKLLNPVKRSSFTPADICQFVLEIDDIDLIAEIEKDGIKYYSLDLQSPLMNSTYKKNYRLIFTTSENEREMIGAITLYRIK